MRAVLLGKSLWAPFVVAGIAGAALIVLAFVSLESYKRASDTTTLAAQTYASAAGVYINVLTAENGQRGYVLTGDEQFLEPYHTALEQLESSLATLEAQIQGNAEEEQLVADVRQAVDARVEMFARVVALRRDGDVGGALALIESGAGIALTEQLAGALGQIVVVEAQQHEDARATAADRVLQTRLVIGALALIAAALLVWVFVSLRRKGVEESLRRSNQAKDEFLGMVSHELRTPITAVMGNARLLLKNGDRLPPETRAASLRDIETEADRLERVVENMLTLSRMERGVTVEREPVLLQRLIQRAVARHTARFADRQIEVAMARDLPPVLAHEAHVEQVLQNLLSNAEKYGATGEPIVIEGRTGEGVVEIAVMDRGPGIPAASREQIFDAFVRLEGSAKRADGAGLGLPVCKRLLEAMDGDILVRDRDGGGAAFVFRLQAVPEPESEEAVDAPAVPATDPRATSRAGQ